MGRIIDKIHAIRRQHSYSSAAKNHKNNEKLRYYSFEFFPPKTEAGLDNLLTRIDRMSNRLDPLFIDVTWGDSGCTWARTMAVASHAQRYCGVDVLLHLTCVGMTREQLSQALSQAKRCGISNILALRGDPPRGKLPQGWQPDDISGGECDRAIDLVRLIRKLHGNYFGIAIAGHPEGHPSSKSVDQELSHMKEKVDAGADFILTQFFYDPNLFIEYVEKCRTYGIDCPILPGMMPIQSYDSFHRMTEFCNISVPASVKSQLEPVQYDDEAVKRIGCQITADMCEQILNHPNLDIDGLHFYTLNLERSVTQILYMLGTISPTKTIDTNKENSLLPPPAAAADFDNGDESKKKDGFQSTLSISPGRLGDSHLVVNNSRSRQFPWRPSAMDSRSKEDVRPIHWANRPKAYISRTEDWDEFPNGRWGDSSSPAFGELSDLSHFYSFTLGSEEDRRGMLGHNPSKPSDIYEVFAKYVEGVVPHLPWCETTLQPESFTIQSQLAALNRKGLLTINSQPPVNGARSEDPTFGWGGSGGYVYQKAYCECFVSPENTNRLMSMISRHPSMILYAVNQQGHELRVGAEEGGVTALTWGVFSNREICQPTIFDPNTFLVWAEEAFSLWTSMWLNLYELDSDSYSLIEDIRDTYYLVALIDNDFITNDSKNTSGNLWNALVEIGEEL